MKKKYVLKVAYRNGAIAESNNSYQYRITAGRPGFLEYAFTSMPVKTWETRETDSPVLEVKEIKDNEGNLAFLEVGILGWQGSVKAEIFVNDHCVLPAHELKEGKIQNSVGMIKRIAVELFQKPEPLSAHAL